MPPCGAGELTRARRVVLEPEHVRIPRGRDDPELVRWRVLGQPRHGALVEPTVDFRVAIRKGEAAGAVVVTPGEVLVELPEQRLVRISGHVRGKVTPVNAILPLVQQDERLCGARVEEV